MDMAHRKHWQDEIESRQRNILPLDTIPNGTAVEGFLIRGDRPFTPVQRAAAIILGVLFCAPGVGGFGAIAMVWAHPNRLDSPRLFFLLTPIVLLISAGWLYLGGKMLHNAFRRRPGI
jgi:hypothetical protein